MQANQAPASLPKSSPMMPILLVFGVLIAIGLSGILWFLSQSQNGNSNPSVPAAVQNVSQPTPSQTNTNQIALLEKQAELDRRETEIKRAELQQKEDELKRKEDELRQIEYETKQQELAATQRELEARQVAAAARAQIATSSTSTLNTSTPPSGSSSWYQVNAHPVLRVRSSPNKSGSIVGKIPNRGKIKVVKAVSSVKTVGGRRGQWVQVEYKNIKGYVFSGFLVALGSSSQASTSSSSSSWYKVKARPHLNIRSAPDVTGKVITSVKNGRQIEVLSRVSSRQSVSGKNGYWVKVKAKGKTGYVFDAYLQK